MISRPEDKELFFVVIPIGPETSEYRGSIVHAVREHAEFDVAIRNDAVLKEDEIW
jgi:hypothetical protein